MEKESYQPSAEEMGKAEEMADEIQVERGEEMMTEKQKILSDERKYSIDDEIKAERAMTLEQEQQSRERIVDHFGRSKDKDGNPFLYPQDPYQRKGIDQSIIKPETKKVIFDIILEKAGEISSMWRDIAFSEHNRESEIAKKTLGTDDVDNEDIRETEIGSFASSEQDLWSRVNETGIEKVLVEGGGGYVLGPKREYDLGLLVVNVIGAVDYDRLFCSSVNYDKNENKALIDKALKQGDEIWKTCKELIGVDVPQGSYEGHKAHYSPQ